MKRVELTAPAGDMEKLKAAIYFGADAVYLSGKSLGLRAFSGNFELDELKAAVEFAHKKGKRAYITINIFAKNADFLGLAEYIDFLEEIGVDAVIVSDIGIIDFIKKRQSNLKIHLSTQASTLNKYAARFYCDYVERIVLARELTIEEIKEIRDFVPKLELEAFVHGAMCVSYSGRCLLSDYLAKRPSNRGECVQSCRYEYALIDKKTGEDFSIEEDNRGTYILNSKDINMLEHLDKLIEAGIDSFKVEGRAKSVYYCAGIINAYSRALDCHYNGRKVDPRLLAEPQKISHRSYSTGFYFGTPEQNHMSSRVTQTYDFIAVVKQSVDDGAIIEQRNRFKAGDVLEVLSPHQSFLENIIVNEVLDLDGNIITDCNRVQQHLLLKTPVKLNEGDILRRKNI